MTVKKQLKRSRKQKKAPQLKRKSFRAPRTSKELFALPRQIQEQWNRAVQVPSEMRAHGLSLAQASKQFGVSAKTVLRLAGAAFRKTRKGKVEVKRSDRLLRVLLIPTTKGLREIAVRDSREASIVGRYWSAVEKYLSRGDASALLKLSRKSVVDERGRRVRLLTKLDELTRQASAGVLRFESMYGRNA
jgi:hypothetical protein